MSQPLRSLSGRLYAPVPRSPEEGIHLGIAFATADDALPGEDNPMLLDEFRTKGRTPIDTVHRNLANGLFTVAHPRNTAWAKHDRVNHYDQFVEAGKIPEFADFLINAATQVENGDTRHKHLITNIIELDEIRKSLKGKVSIDAPDVDYAGAESEVNYMLGVHLTYRQLFYNVFRGRLRMSASRHLNNPARIHDKALRARYRQIISGITVPAGFSLQTDLLDS